MEDQELVLKQATLAPYVFKAMALIGVKRRAGSNMFRHQIATMGILLDYKYVEPLLLKASLIHDLFEDAPGKPGVSQEEITCIDSDGPAVYALVMEVTRRDEPKSVYLQRVMASGSRSAKVLKLADRISNLFALGFVHEEGFVSKYLKETREYILPYAPQINPDMCREISDLVTDREHYLQLFSRLTV